MRAKFNVGQLVEPNYGAARWTVGRVLAMSVEDFKKALVNGKIVNKHTKLYHYFLRTDDGDLREPEWNLKAHRPDETFTIIESE